MCAAARDHELPAPTPCGDAGQQDAPVATKTRGRAGVDGHTGCTDTKVHLAIDPLGQTLAVLATRSMHTTVHTWLPWLNRLRRLPVQWWTMPVVT